jgi:hypothetical protein
MDAQTGPKKRRGRGRVQESLHLIDRMYAIAEERQPITGRGIGYRLFVEKLIPDMSRQSMAKVYRLLKEAREEGIIPWEWIVAFLPSRHPTRGTTGATTGLSATTASGVGSWTPWTHVNCARG